MPPIATTIAIAIGIITNKKKSIIWLSYSIFCDLSKGKLGGGNFNPTTQDYLFRDN
jgi:hypothetical protein